MGVWVCLSVGVGVYVGVMDGSLLKVSLTGTG